MTASKNRKLIYTSLFSGLLLGLLLILHANTIASSVHSVLALILLYIIVITLGLLTGYTLRKDLPHPYLVAVFALLYANAVGIVISVTKIIHYAIYIALVVAAAIGLFQVANRFFRRSTPSKSVKIVLATVGFIIFVVVCSGVGLYFNRLAASM